MDSEHRISVRIALKQCYNTLVRVCDVCSLTVGGEVQYLQ
jgi:hypothetical protein